MAEWLRRLTRNQIPSGSAGSSPADCGKRFFLEKKYMEADQEAAKEVAHGCSNVGQRL